MNTLAINFNHDGAAVVFREGKLAGYVNTERFSRKKKHPGVRAFDIEEVLSQAVLKLRDIECVQLVNLNNMDTSDVGRLHGTSLKETWPEFWINNSFDRVRILDHTLPCKLVSERLHQVLHTATAYHYSPFDSAVCLACDPTGAEALFMRGSTLICRLPQRQLVAPAVYHQVAKHIFGNGLFGAGKLMGLAPYGEEGAATHIDYAAVLSQGPQRAFDTLVKQTSEQFVHVVESGRALNASLAFHTQALLEFELTTTFRRLHEIAGELGIEPNLCLSGGTSLNSVANQRCFEQSPFENLYLHPACGDDGTAIGACLLHWHGTLKQPRQRRSNRDAMYSCRTYDERVEEAIRRHERNLTVVRTPDDIGEAAAHIASGQVIGWFQGASEIGPRALGNRSILADPRNPTMKDHLNSRVKRREGFRPFAPSVLAEHRASWFPDIENPFMLRVGRVRGTAVPAVTHVDGSARFQTVQRADNPRYHELITRFYRLTGIPLVLNTSFNGPNEPIVETPEDAVECLLSAKLDAVVFPGLTVRARSIGEVRTATGEACEAEQSASAQESFRRARSAGTAGSAA